MKLNSLVAALASGLVLEAMAGPLAQDYTGARAKRAVPASYSLHERHLDNWSQQWSKKSKVRESASAVWELEMKSWLAALGSFPGIRIRIRSNWAER